MATRDHLRHEMAIRLLTVSHIDQLTPSMVRVTLIGDALEDFSAPGPTDHVKVFFPDPATGELTIPELRADGLHRPARARRGLPRGVRGERHHRSPPPHPMSVTERARSDGEGRSGDVACPPCGFSAPLQWRSRPRPISTKKTASATAFTVRPQP